MYTTFMASDLSLKLHLKQPQQDNFSLSWQTEAKPIWRHTKLILQLCEIKENLWANSVFLAGFICNKTTTQLEEHNLWKSLCLSLTANKHVVVSCSRLPLSNHIMWLSSEATGIRGCLRDDLRLISTKAIQQIRKHYLLQRVRIIL